MFCIVAVLVEFEVPPPERARNEQWSLVKILVKRKGLLFFFPPVTREYDNPGSFFSAEVAVSAHSSCSWSLRCNTTVHFYVLNEKKSIGLP